MFMTDSGSPIVAWGADGAGFVACDPANHAAAVVAARERGWPLVLCVEAAPDTDLVTAESVNALGLRADAYASDVGSFAQAVAFVRRTRGAHPGPRLTYLGSLGERRPPLAPSLGTSFDIAPEILIGRMERCTICLRQGWHSDQNTVARLHARIERVGDAVRLFDLRSTNGTTVNGERVTERRDLVPGDEIAVAWSHRFLFD
ncbi:MAG TPA: FHA domain-containing protein [Polyangiaceae bacterium]|jgi:hypothetical protein